MLLGETGPYRVLTSKNQVILQMGRCSMGNGNEGCCGCNQDNVRTFVAVCPRCEDEGIPVSKVTVEHLVQEEFCHSLDGEQYNICMNASCDIVYFGVDNEKHYTQEQVRVPVWFKDGANPKYACYCSEITEGQVLDAVVTLGLKSLKDVINATGAMKNSNCIEKNPLGVCCHKIIEEAIAKGLGPT